MKRIALLAIITFGLLCTIPQVHAETLPLALPLTCDRSKGLYKEMTTLVVVPLDTKTVKEAGQSDEDVAKSIFYDFVYARGNKASPFNAVAVNGKIYFLSCMYPDYLANVETGLTQGVFTLGVIGTMPVKEIQTLVDQYKITSFLESSMATNDTKANKNTTIALANIKACTVCSGLHTSKKGLADRAYSITVSDISVSKSVRQQEQVAFSLKIKNTGTFPLYAVGIVPLRLVSLSKGISPVYNSSWISLTEVVRLGSILVPDAETTLSVTLNSPLLPGTYKDSFAFKVGNTTLGKVVPVTFTVENDNLTLGKVVSKDGAPFANLRSTPSLKGLILGKLDIGTYVIIKGYQDAWVKIETKEGKSGWVYKPFMRAL